MSRSLYGMQLVGRPAGEMAVLSKTRQQEYIIERGLGLLYTLEGSDGCATWSIWLTTLTVSIQLLKGQVVFWPLSEKNNHPHIFLYGQPEEWLHSLDAKENASSIYGLTSIAVERGWQQLSLRTII